MNNKLSYFSTWFYKAMLLPMFIAVSIMLSSCGGGGAESADENLDKSPVSKFALPSKLRDDPLPEGGSLRGVLVIDDGVEQEMTLVGDNAEIRLDNLSLGTHSFLLYYVFDHPEFGESIYLADAEKEFVIEAGENFIGFEDSDFSTSFDDDSDGMSNLDELVSGRHPLIDEALDPPEEEPDPPEEEPEPPEEEPEPPVEEPEVPEAAVLINLPDFIVIGDLPQGRLSALLTLNDAAEEMTFNAEQSRFELGGLSPGQVSLSLALEFSHPEYGDGIRIAETTVKTVDIVEGENNVVFSVQDYNIEIDTDNDGLSNLLELLGNRNPLVAEDTTLPLANLVFPPTNTVTYDETVVVRGTASDDASGVGEVRVNGVVASSNDAFATWVATVPLALGSTSLSIEVSDNAGNLNTEALNIATIRRVNPLRLEAPKDIVFDSRLNRALITDVALRGIVAIDLLSGEHTMFSDGSRPNNAVSFLSPEGLVIDSASGRALVVDGELGSIIEVDLLSGQRSIFSDEISGASDIAIDSAGLRVLLTDYAEGEIIEVDLVDGDVSEEELVSGPLPIAIDVEVRAGQADRALVLTEAPAVNSFDFLSSVTRVVSSNREPLFSEPFIRPVDIAVDYVNERALVVDQGHRSITEVDLINGSREFLSDPSTPNLENPFIDPLSIAIDADNNRGLVIDSAWNRLFSVDLLTGAREIISNHSTPDSRLPFFRPSEVTYDANNQRLVLVDSERSTVYNVDINTGQRTHTSFGSTGASPENPSSAPVDIIVQADNEDAYILDAQQGAIFLFSNVGQSLLSGQNAGVSLLSASDLALDVAGNRLFVADSDLPAIVAVDRNNGQRSVFSDNSTNAENPFVNPTELVIDLVNNRLLVVDNAAAKIFSLSLADGTRSLMWDFADTESGLTLDNVTDIALDTDNNRLVILDNIGNEIIAIDLDSGLRSVLSNPVSPNIFENASGLFVDSERNWAYVSDEASGAVFVVDLTTGEPLIFSQ